MSEDVKIDDKDFDVEGNPIITRAYDDLNRDRVAQPNDKDPNNTNSQKIAQIVRENISTSSAALLRGVITVSEKIDQQGRTIVVEVKTGVNTVNAANELRKLMGS